MARAPLYESIVTEDSAKRLVGIDGAEIEVLDRDSLSAVTVYDQETGGAGFTDPIVADEKGRFQGWVDPGRYTLRITVDGGTPSTFPLDVGVGESVLPDTLDLAPTSIEPILDMTPKSPGMFFEADQGVTGVALSAYDPPQPNYINQVSGTLGTSSLTYANDVLLAGLPGAIKCSSTGGAGNTYFSFQEPDVDVDSMVDHYGSLYIYLDTANTVNLRPVWWLDEGGSSCGFLRITTARRVAFFDKSSAQVGSDSTTVLSAATWYRLEWRLDGTTSANVTIRIYAGHSTTILETMTITGVDLRDARGTIRFGNTSGAALAGHDFRIAAIAEQGTDWFGPYGDTSRQIVARVLNPDGASLFELHSDGSLIKRLDRTIDHQPGGANHYRHFRGAPVFKIDPVGSVAIGVNGNYKSTIDYDPDKLYDIFLNAQTGRISATSFDLSLFNDPSDIAFSRKFPMYNPARTGTGAATTNGSSTVTFSDLTLELLDVGRYFQINGTDCHITALNSPTSCEMDVTFGATASGLSWLANEHPYPGDRMKGVTGTGSHVGQLRLTLPFTPFIRQSTLGTCTITIASPAVITKNSHGLVANDPVVFTTTGALPTGLVAGTTYYVISAGLTSNAFQVAATVGAAAINTSGSQSGTHTVQRPLANVTSGSATIANMPGFTSADVGRALMFKGDFTLGEFAISAVGASTITVGKVADGNSPQFTDAAASWALTGGNLDQEISANYQPFTMVMGTAGGGARKWSSGSLYSAPCKVEFQMGTNDSDDSGVGVGLNSGGGVHTVMSIDGGSDSSGRSVLFGAHGWVSNAGKTIGYKPSSGVGAAVTQGTSKTTAVTINASSGQITTFNDALNAGVSATFQVNNSYVTADDIIVLNIKSGTTADTYQTQIAAVAAGSFKIQLRNFSVTNRSEAVVMNFAIIKGAGTT